MVGEVQEYINGGRKRRFCLLVYSFCFQKSKESDTTKEVMISASEREEFLLFRNKRGYGMEGVIMTIKRITDVSGDLKKIPVVLRREGAGDQ